MEICQNLCCLQFANSTNAGILFLSYPRLVCEQDRSELEGDGMMTHRTGQLALFILIFSWTDISMAHFDLGISYDGLSSTSISSGFYTKEGQYQLILQGVSGPEHTQIMPGIGVYRGTVSSEEQALIDKLAELACSYKGEWRYGNSGDPSLSFNVERDGQTLCQDDMSPTAMRAANGGHDSIATVFVTTFHRLIPAFYAHGEKIIHITAEYDVVKRIDGQFWVSLTFINSGREAVTLESPEQWLGAYKVSGINIGGTLPSVVSLAKDGEYVDMMFGGKELLKKAGETDRPIRIDPGRQYTLQFVGNPYTQPSPETSYNFGGSVFFDITEPKELIGKAELALPSKIIRLPNRPPTCHSRQICPKTGLWSPSIAPHNMAVVYAGQPMISYGCASAQQEAAVLWTWVSGKSW